MNKFPLQIRPAFAVCLLLFVLVFSVYLPVITYPFINFDDNAYVTANPYVQKGLTSENLIWAFSFKNKDLTYWHPLTWLSHMADCHLYGLNSGMHHLTSLLFHIANTLLLFTVFRQMTGMLWQSAFAAALFALHPVNTDSVAWIAERKNLLSTFFWLLTMLFYAYYSVRPSLLRYLLTLSVFAAGLLAKPMLVTLPFVLLLLDYWPLGRICPIGFEIDGKILFPRIIKKFFRLVSEKIPFFVLSAAAVYISSASLQAQENFIPAAAVPFGLRISNALISYILYIGKFVWPSHLAIYYPYPDAVPLWQALVSLMLLMLISFWIISRSVKNPCICAGWLWYMGTLVPVSGLVQAGLWPAMADRWAYVPFIGLYLIVSWGIPEVTKGWRQKNRILSAMAVLILALCMTITRMQIEYWRDDIALFRHALDITKDNPVTRNNLGSALASRKTPENTEEAIHHFSQAIRLKPDYAKAHNNLGILLVSAGRLDEAFAHFSEVIRIDSRQGDALTRLSETYAHMADVLIRKGRLEEATEYCYKVVKANPEDAHAQNDLGVALASLGRMEEAAKHFSKALRISPEDTEIYDNLLKAKAKIKERK